MEYKKPKLYTVNDVAKIMERSASWVYEMISTEQLKPRLRRGSTRGYLFKPEDLDAFFENELIDAKEAKNGVNECRQKENAPRQEAKGA